MDHIIKLLYQNKIYLSITATSSNHRPDRNSLLISIRFTSKINIIN
jgi:hypothetical protein